jgi:hypothetical protein
MSPAPSGERGLKAKRPLTHNTAAQLQRLAQERADEQARRIPWQRLNDTRKQYVDWQEFCLWVRSIIEAEGGMPEWLSTVVDQRCPGFLQGENGTASTRPLGLRLEDWMDEHIFGFARKEGWFNAVQYYAVRDPRYQRAEDCWAECVKKWSQARPIRYPCFEEWQAMAAACDETAHLVPEQRKAQASARLVDRERLEEAIARYIDWEAFAYWARPALEHGLPIRKEVSSELEHRCPGFLAQSVDTGKIRAESVWEDLMAWIAESFFTDAKAEGWFDAILVGAQRHPRAIRTMDYADHWEEIRGPNLPVPYPYFDDWRRDADAMLSPKTNQADICCVPDPPLEDRQTEALMAARQDLTCRK